MKCSVRNNAKSVALVVIMLLIPIIATAQSNNTLPSADQMTIWRARRMFSGVSDYREIRRAPKIDRSSFRVSQDSIEFDAAKSKGGTREHYSIDLRTLEPISVTCKDHHAWFYCELLNGWGKSLDRDLPLSRVFYSGPWGVLCVRKTENYTECVTQLTYAGSMFASALSRMHTFANDAGAPLRTFKERAAAWRALTPKPAIPDDVRVQRLLAEDAIKSKSPAVALFHYESGLEIDPTWAQGYFNAALVAAELEVYAQAAEHMQSYLELVPDAPDAQSARDQIAIWQYKAKGTR